MYNNNRQHHGENYPGKPNSNNKKTLQTILKNNTNNIKTVGEPIEIESSQ